VQETLLRAWRYRDSLKEGAPLRPWLYRVATNACLDAIARDERRAVLVAKAEADDGWAGQPDDVVWLGPIPDSVLDPPTPPERTPEALTLKRETIEIALEAAETGHLVLSTLHTIDASKTIERIVGVFPSSDQPAIRGRLAKSFRYIISQRLIPKPDGTGRVAVFEILKSTLRTREYVQKGETEGKSLLDAMRDGSGDGMQCFDIEIEKLIRSKVLDMDTGMAYATNEGNLRLLLADLSEDQRDNIPSGSSTSAQKTAASVMEEMIER